MATDKRAGESSVEDTEDQSKSVDSINDCVLKKNRKDKIKGEWTPIIGEEPELVSELIARGRAIPGVIVDAYASYAQYLYQKGGTKTPKEKEFMSDYLANHNSFHACRGIANKDESDSDKEVTPPLSDSVEDAIIGDDSNVSGNNGRCEVQSIDLNKLVRKPLTFDGVKPPARRWLEDYERAAVSNFWNDQSRVRYFSTFLSKAAHDWFASMAAPRLSISSTWSDVRILFIKHWIGEQDRLAVRRIIDKMYQNEKESIRTFMPRLVRMIKTIDPDKPPDELVEMVKIKLRPAYQEKLTMFVISTLEELNEKCLQIEAGMEAAATKEVRRFERKRDDNRGERSKKTRNDRPKGDKSKMKDLTCYKCDRKGHIATNCRCKTKADGSPCNKKPYAKSERSVNVVKESEDSSHANTKEESQQERPQPIVTIRQAGKTAVPIQHACCVAPMLVGGGNLLICKVRVNEKEVEAIVDTGAFVSVIDGNIAEANSWSMEHSKTKLVHAGGEEMHCMGETQAKIEVCVGKRSKFATHNLVVVKNLCAQMLLGIELIRSLGIRIDVSAERPIIFKRTEIIQGLVSKGNVAVPPRSAMIATVRTDLEHGEIITVPFGFDSSLLVANAVTKVVNFEAKILLLNIDRVTISIDEGQRIASY